MHLNRLLIVLTAVHALTIRGCAGASDPYPERLPEGVLPAMGCWFWTGAEFKPEGYRPFLDLVGRHADFNLLTTSLRVPQRELTEEAVHAQIKQAALAARRQAMGLVMDLDVRLARTAFQRAHADELQEMLRLREVDLPDSDEVALTVAADVPSDHYTFRTTPYVPVSARLVRVYSYRREGGPVEQGSVKNITEALCRIKEIATNQMTVAISCSAATRGRRACVLVAFAHLTPDVFAPHLMAFQRQILRRYSDVALAGACKDEWGFPPCFDGCPTKNDFWFSRFYATAYAQRTGGRDLVRDCLLMYLGEQGRERERQAAIDHYQELAWQRNAALEDDFYRATKQIFGPKAIVATHPTWWPYPDLREFKKNGLDWWAATRDLAQTDEVTPFAVRTALAKKWGSPVWYNMFYSASVADYERSIWTHALGGGRLNFHPLWPSAQTVGPAALAPLLRGDLMRGAARIRLLNFISHSPLDCPVAVIFGHACAMNWAGPAYNDVGLKLTDALWQRGYPADLVPADEIRSGALKVERQGWIRYGAQRYAAAVLFHPEFEPGGTAAFFRKANRGPTALWRLGEWTRDKDGRSLAPSLPARMALCRDVNTCADQVVARLRQRGVEAQTPATGTIGWDQQTASPPCSGTCRLVDGTVIVLAGTHGAAGDLIQTNFVVHGQPVEAEAVGVFAVRLAKDGRVLALAAGGLRRFRAGNLNLRLDLPVDLALWREREGQMRGVLQDWSGPIPAPLANLTPHWLRLAVPKPLAAP